MPLLGKKVFSTTPMSPQNGTTDAPYLIPHTKERFESKSEFEKRKDLYNQTIWTCRATGHTGLTHEEACQSENTTMEQLRTQFPKCFEKDVLALVHHNTISLETIVDKAWWKINQQFLIGEKVNLKVKVADKLIPATIVNVDKSTYQEGKSSACNSPSSDKENSSDEKKEKDKTPKKWVPPKFLPYTYSIELQEEAKTIHSVPAADLQRIERSPSKDLIRLFVRVSAIRSGTAATSPWIVNSDLVSQYRLVSKFADFFFSPMKVADAMKKAEENDKKRKMSNGTPGSAAKKLKLDKSGSKEKKVKSAQKKDSERSSEKKKKKKKDKNSLNKSQTVTPKSVSPAKKSTTPKKKTASDAVVISSSDSEDDISLAKLKPSSTANKTASDSDSDVPLYQLAEQTTPRKKKTSGDSSDEDVPLSKITPSTPKKRLSNGSSNSNKKKATPLKKKEEKGKDKKKTAASAGKANKVEKDGKKKKHSKVSPKKKDGLKQVTLYDLTKKGKLQHASSVLATPKKSSPAKTPSKTPPKAPPTPAIVRRLLGMKQDSIREKMLYSGLLKKAVSVLSPAQVKVLPDKLRTALEQKKQSIEEKERMAKMSPEELEAYTKEKKAKAKEAQKQRMLQKLRDQRKRFEDMDLQLTPLPTAKLVPTPDGFPNSLFGEVAMVTEFINCYSGLLMPDSEYPIYTDALMKALVGGASGFTYLSRVLNVLLQTLLQDQIAKGCEELSTQLSDIAVSPYTASELVRLCIRRDEDEDDDDFDDRDVPDEYVKLLEESEFFELDVEKKLSVLRALCLQVLGTDAVQDYMIEQQGKAGQLTKQKVLEMREMAAQKKSDKQNNADSKDKGDKKSETETSSKKQKDEKQTGDEKVNKDGSLSILSFYGKEAKDSGTDDNGDESKDWGSIVKSRRILAAKAAEEKERRERERAAQRERELEEEKQKERLKKKSDQIDEAITLARMVLRQEPIGTDRNHDRYWVFTNTTPGLYVEKGWMGEEVNYKVAKPDGAVGEPMSESEDEDKSVSQTGTTPLKVVYKTKRHVIETSMPHPGQNLWFTYRSQKDVDSLLKSLHPQGIRESLLKKEIKARYDDLLRAIIQAQRTNLALRDCDGEKEIVEGFKKELTDMELRLRNGGLGGVADYEKFEARLTGATDTSVMGECLLEVKEGILEKFLQGFMRPVVKSEVKEEEESEEEDEEETAKEGQEGQDQPKEKEHKREKAVREWREAIETCQTMSRLHVLMAILDSCIKWEKSAENAKCKICRKKCDDARLLLCDECNQAFHMYCLRPAISKLPTGDWFCPACKPRQRQVRPVDLESDGEEEEKETACRECGGREKLIFCTKCPAAFHTQCHDPPLRHPPRGEWECTDCKSGVSGRRKGKLSRRAAPRRNFRQLADPSDDESGDDEDEEEEDEESEEETQRTRSSRSRSARSQRKSQGSSTRSRDRQRQTSAANSRNHGSSTRSSRTSRGGDVDQDTTPTTSRNSRRGPSELSLCEDILQKVMKNKNSWPFLEPVDKKVVPDYYTLIKKPMDFQTMLKKCARLSYASPQEFIEDAALVFENAESYNKPDSEVYACMQTVEKQLKDLLGKVLPDWTYYRTVLEHSHSNTNLSDSGRRRSRNK